MVVVPFIDVSLNVLSWQYSLPAIIQIEMRWWVRLLCQIGAPLMVSLIFLAGTSPPLRCAYVVLLMAIYWYRDSQYPHPNQLLELK